MTQKKSRQLETIGWREWVGLPDLDIRKIKAKVDTGARSSSLHAFDVEKFRKRKKDWVRFLIHPIQRESKTTIEAEAELLDERRVRSSSGQSELRPVILTTIELLGRELEVELTLTNRDVMGFRMLLGREALRGRFLVDASRSYYDRARAPKHQRRTRFTKAKKK